MFYKYHYSVCWLDLSLLSHVCANGGVVSHTGQCCQDKSLPLCALVVVVVF